MSTDLIRPPGPPPLRGLLPRLRYYRAFTHDVIGFVRSRFEAYGDVYYVPASDGGNDLYVTRHPDHFRDVLVTHAGSYLKTHSAFTRLARVLGQGLLTTDGETWKRHRRMIQPAFHRGRLRDYASMMVEETERAMQSWRDGETLDLGRTLATLTLRVVSRALFSHEIEDDVRAITSAVSVLQESFSRPDMLPRWVPTRGRRQVREALAAIDSMTYRIIAARRAAGAQTGAPDLLQMLLETRDLEGDGRGLTDREIRDQLVTFFVAGHETTSHALTWTLYLLSQHPAAESALHRELDRELDGRRPGFDDFDRLRYTEQIVLESMRLYPPVYALARRAGADTTLGDYTVPAGSDVALWLYMAHHDARWFPDPEVFQPERFAADGNVQFPRNAYLPFGLGARTCIGKSFATIEAVLILATICRRFRLALTPGHPVGLKARVTLMPKYGMKMVPQQRGKA